MHCIYNNVFEGPEETSCDVVIVRQANYCFFAMLLILTVENKKPLKWIFGQKNHIDRMNSPQ